METDFLEECWFLYGIRIRSVSIGFLKFHCRGSYAQVKWDWKKAFMPLLLGWYHSHPGEYMTFPSSVDDRTMRSWVKGYAKPFLCGIYCGLAQYCYCYYRGPESTLKKTVVRKVDVDSWIIGPLFFGIVKKDSKSYVA